MNKIIQQMADHCIEVIDEHIDETIHWQLHGTEYDNEEYEFHELELKIKQQILFTLIKRVTK